MFLGLSQFLIKIKCAVLYILFFDKINEHPSLRINVKENGK